MVHEDEIFTSACGIPGCCRLQLRVNALHIGPHTALVFVAHMRKLVKKVLPLPHMNDTRAVRKPTSARSSFMSRVPRHIEFIYTPYLLTTAHAIPSIAPSSFLVVEIKGQMITNSEFELLESLRPHPLSVTAFLHDAAGVPRSVAKLRPLASAREGEGESSMGPYACAVM